MALLVAIIATVMYRKYSFGRAKYFLYSFWLIALTEFSYRIIYDLFNGEVKTLFVGNFYTAAQFSFYILWFRSLLVNRKRRNFFLGAFIFFLAFIIIDSLLIQSFYDQNQTYVYSVGVLLVIAGIFSYFIEFLRSERIIKFERSVYFWFSLGILLFHIPYLPFRYAAEFLGFKGNPVYSFVVNMLNIIMHSCFLIGILWSQKRYNY